MRAREKCCGVLQCEASIIDYTPHSRVQSQTLGIYQLCASTEMPYLSVSSSLSLTGTPTALSL